MRSSVAWLAFGLAANIAFARRCKPRPKPSTPSSLIETATPSTSSQATDTVDVPTPISPSSQTTPLDEETATLTPTDIITITPTPPTISITPTTTLPTTSSTSTTTSTSSTSAAPLPSPTFSITGLVPLDGDSPVNGSPLQGVSQDGTIFIFNPNFGGTTTRNFILDPITGRVRDRDTGTPVCAYYGYSTVDSFPAHVGYCQNGNTGRDSLYDYLTCRVVSGKLSCTSPKAACVFDDDFFQDTCTTSPGSEVNSEFYYRYSSSGGNYLFISSGNPSGYTRVDLLVQEA